MPRKPTGRPRGRPKNLKPGEPGYEEWAALREQRQSERAAAVVAEAEAGNADPMRDPEEFKTFLRLRDKYEKKRDLKYFADNDAYWRDRLRIAIENGDKNVPNMQAALKMNTEEAAIYGYDAASLADPRSELDKLREFLDKLVSANENVGGRLIELTEQEIIALENKMTEAVQHVANAEVEYAEKTRADLGKAFRDLLLRVRRLQMAAKQEVPTPEVQALMPVKWNPFQTAMRRENTWKASLMLRHATYVMRTNLSSRQRAGGAASLPDWRRHHAHIAWNFHMVWTRTRVTPDGWIRSRDWEGSIISIGPGHGKTFSAVSWISLCIARNPYLKVLVTHASDDKASVNLQWLGSLFDRGTPAGRRLTALYPHLRLKGKVSATQFRLDTQERSKQPTCVADGVTARISGGDADIVWFDDVVDKSEREQPEERRRKKAHIAEWMRRIRDDSGRHITTTTLWHEDDATCDLIRKAEIHKLHIKCLRIPCGGPKGSRVSRVPFHAVWPEAVPSRRLKAEYARDPVGYAATYMCDPHSEAAQIIRRLRFYDPTSQEHREFLNTCVRYLSIDPSVVARQGADKTSMVYAGHGEVVGEVDGVRRSENRLRILDARQFLCAINDVVPAIALFSTEHRVDYVAVEVVGAFASIPQTLRNEFGVDCIECPTGNKSKEIRLRGVATLIDHTAHAMAGGAVVEFPGVRRTVGNTVVVEPDPNYDWMYRQFMRFGTIKDDHALDAVVQLAAHLARTGELESGAGYVTQKFAQAISTRSEFQNRLAKMLEDANAASKETGDAGHDDVTFIGQGVNGWM